jgi:hypothetical protein
VSRDKCSSWLENENRFPEGASQAFQTMMLFPMAGSATET